jgi:hypothetical protein
MRALYHKLFLVALWLTLLTPAPITAPRPGVSSQPRAGLVQPVTDGGGLENECGSQGGASSGHGGC